MKKIHPLLLSVTSGVLLWASWPVSPLTFLVFTGFVPLLWLENQGTGSRRFFYAVFLAMLLWNMGTTWWVCHASLPGGIVAMLFSSAFMSLPWLGYYFIKKRLGEKWGLMALVVFWLSFEYTYLNIQLSWPWLTLGNVFALHPEWVQWYEYTGSSGGSLWVLLVNVFIYRMLSNLKARVRAAQNKALWLTSIALVIPLSLSYLLSAAISRTFDAGGEVVVVQPNIDPYEKFNASSQYQQLQQLISLSESKISSTTTLVVWPETALSGASGFNEENIKAYPALEPLWQFLVRNPGISLFTGIEGYKIYNEENKTSTARKMSGSSQYFDVFNSAIILDSGSDSLIFYHKSKLVPGVETLPTYLKIFDKWFEQFGGTSGGYAGQEERTVLTDQRKAFKIAPAICYESVYGEFLTAYMRNGANVIAIITNDGWWQNTGGYRQHMQYARLRAVETRRWVIRSANTGISCFIDPYGKVADPQPWDTAAAIRMRIPTTSYLTFFVRHGDIISKISVCTAGILLLWGIASRKRKHGAKQEHHL
ncbi:MAG: apolipoprotein N-acyltransferase [Chitinophagaceae bacterium]|nr:apolipoprotein N-acyltransferase [Chitinophagaceae bacterium]